MANDAVYVNFDEGLKRMMNNPKLYVKLLAKFRDGAGTGSFEALERAFAEGDMESVLSEAHTLKGLAANLSLAELAAQCLELETLAKNGELDLARMEAVRAAFVETLKEIEKAIAEHG